MKKDMSLLCRHTETYFVGNPGPATKEALKQLNGKNSHEGSNKELSELLKSFKSGSEVSYYELNEEFKNVVDNEWEENNPDACFTNKLCQNQVE